MIFKTYVPPSGPIGAKIVLVGESPGFEEEQHGAPFVGDSGQKLIEVLNRAGKLREDVRLMNLCNYRPAGNKFELLYGSQELAQGQAELVDYLLQFKSETNVIGALGKQALKFLTGKDKIFSWRGSILPCIIPGLEDVKVIGTFHPAFILRDRTLYPIFDQDIKRIVEDSEFKEFNYPQRTYIIDPKGVEREEWTEKLCAADWLGTDIESVTGTDHILCIGFAPSPNLAVVFVNDGSSHYHDCVQRILKSRAKKIFHFGTFDTEVLKRNGFEIENYDWDTMAAQHTMQPELPRGLDFLTSIYTREPYYKQSGRDELPSDVKSWSSKAVKEDVYRYNGKDCGVTIEIALQQMKEMTLDERRIFNFSMDQIRELAPHISNAGMLVDQERREIFRRALLTRWGKLQAVLDLLSSMVNAHWKGKIVNAKSTPMMRKLLYEDLALPPKRKRAKDGKQGVLTADEDAIVQLIGHCADKIAEYKTQGKKDEWRQKLGVLRLILEIRGVRQLLSNYINIAISEDGRVRSTYKVTSTETARWAAESYVDGTGNNAQTWPREALEIPEDLLDLTKQWDTLPLFSIDDDDSDGSEADEVEDTEYAKS